MSGSRLKVTSFNCKNIKSSNICIEEIMKHSDIILLQEHWLFNYELPSLECIHPNLSAAGKATDDENPIAALQKPRGYGGVAILWNKTLDESIEVLNEGGCRVQAIILHDTVLIITVYLPTRGPKENDTKYEEVLDQVSDIIAKYEHTDLILGGDFNADITRTDKSKRKDTLNKFLKEQNLTQPGERLGSTFIHPNGTDSSCIDYLFVKGEHTGQDAQVKKLDSIASNTSDHYPVSLHYNLKSQGNLITPKGREQEKQQHTASRKINWSKTDLTKYQTRIEDSLREILPRKQLDNPSRTVESTETLITLMQGAAAESNPRRKQHSKPNRTRTILNPQIKKAIIANKKALWEWKRAGKPRNPQHKTVLARKKHKKQLRSQINTAVARKHQSKIQELSTASIHQKQEMFKLIKEQRKKSSTNTQQLEIEGEMLTSAEDVCNGWATHFGKLAIPSEGDGYNEDYKKEVELDIATIQEMINVNKGDPPQFNIQQVQKAINALKNKKAPDADGITAEHLKYAGILMTSAITKLVNAIMKAGQIPSKLKLGIVTPIWKKNEKTKPTNYRGITVISVIGKIVESLLRTRIAPTVLKTQNPLQRGFTKGTSPLNAALIMQESIMEAKTRKRPLYIALLDAKSAFDVVSHNSLLRKLYLSGIQDELWSIIANTFCDATSVVKWNGLISKPFEIHQGVRQGGILSTDQYKTYINDLLDRLQQTSHGTKIGDIHCPAPTCADDVALMADTREDLQAMLDLCHDYSQYERYRLQPAKSMVLVYNSNVPFHQLQNSEIFKLGSASIPIVSQGTHLGIIRDTDSAGNIPTVAKNVTNARKALYSMMGTGMHGTNGLPPATNVYLMNIYIMPILLYGLEILLPSEKEMDTATKFHESSLRQLLSLPSTCAKPAIYILSGHIPLAGQIHHRALTFFGNIIRNENTLEYKLAYRQLLMGHQNNLGWFGKIGKILAQYDLPAPSTLLLDPPGKKEWARTVQKATRTFWKQDICTKARLYSSLNLMNTDGFTPGGCHPVVDSVTTSPADIRRVGTAHRFMTGTVLLQSNRHRFNQYEVNPSCPLCSAPQENRQHVLVTCPAYKGEREELLTRILPFLNITNSGMTDQEWARLIIDPANAAEAGQILEENLKDVYLQSRIFMAKVMRQRKKMINPT
jgi:endonuclease/exonuclease/phosphatase family metal-dependent hydrolase